MNVRSMAALRVKGACRFLGFFLFALLAAILMAAPGQAGPTAISGSTGKIVIADGSSINSAPLYVALTRGYFKQEGIGVDCRLYPSGKDALDAVRRGEADLATVADIPIMYAVLEEVPIAVVANIAESILNDVLLIRKDRGIVKEKDLLGKKIGVTPGTTSEFFLDDFLLFNRIARDRVKVVPLSPSRVLEALEKGEVDAVVTWDHYLPKLKEKMGPNLIINYGKGRYRMLWNLAGLKTRLAENPAAVPKILRALIRGVAFIREKPEEAGKITADFLGLHQAQVRAVWGNYNFQVSLPSLLLMNLENQARWAIRNKAVPKVGVPNFLPYFYFEGLTAVDPEAVTIVH